MNRVMLGVASMLVLLLGNCTARKAGNDKHVEAAGYFGNRFELALDRVLAGESPRFDAELILADAMPRHVRRFTNFSGDVSGRYIEALSVVTGFRNAEVPGLQELVLRVLTHQKEDGHFGDPLHEVPLDDDMAILWGNGRLLMGLLEYYRVSEDEEVLETARELGNFLVDSADTFNSEKVQEDFKTGKFAVGYICWTQNIEGLVELYRVTGDSRYLDLARQMAARTLRQPLQHSHGFLTSLRGILELYRLTHEPSYLEQVRRNWQEIIDSGNRLVHGAIPEMLDDLWHRDEGCSEADWLRLNLTLWDLTAETRYLDEAELTLFNEFCFNQFPTGDFGHSAFHPSRGGGPATAGGFPTGHGAEGARAWWCCTFHGLRAFPEIFRHAFQLEDTVLSYLLPVQGRLDAGETTYAAESTLEQDGKARLRIPASAPIQRLRIRRPAWAEDVRLSMAGEALKAVASGEFLELETPPGGWGDLDVSWEMKLTPIHRQAGSSRQIAFRYGPWILGVDEGASPHFFDEPFPGNRIDVTEAGPRKTATPSPDEESPFSVPIAHFLLDYRPGGYPIQTATALLRPIAERTGRTPLVAWEFWFTTAPSEEQ